MLGRESVFAVTDSISQQVMCIVTSEIEFNDVLPLFLLRQVGYPRCAGFTISV